MKKTLLILLILTSCTLILFSGCSSPEFIEQEFTKEVYGHYFESQDDEFPLFYDHLPKVEITN